MATHSRLSSFITHAQTRGVKLMRDDIVFIDRMLNGIPKNDFKQVLTRYLEEWIAGLGKDTKMQGRGRRRANLWLLERANGK